MHAQSIVALNLCTMPDFLEEDAGGSVEKEETLDSLFSSSLFRRMEIKQAKLREIPPLVDKNGRAFFPQAQSKSSGGQSGTYESSLFAKLIKSQKDSWYLPDVNVSITFHLATLAIYLV